VGVAGAQHRDREQKQFVEIKSVYRLLNTWKFEEEKIAKVM